MIISKHVVAVVLVVGGLFACDSERSETNTAIHGGTSQGSGGAGGGGAAGSGASDASGATASTGTAGQGGGGTPCAGMTTEAAWICVSGMT